MSAYNLIASILDDHNMEYDIKDATSWGSSRAIPGDTFITIKDLGDVIVIKKVENEIKFHGSWYLWYISVPALIVSLYDQNALSYINNYLRYIKRIPKREDKQI